jgi:phage terminase small subunit
MEQPSSAKEKAWFESYFGKARFNATEAARLAGYKWPGKIGWRKKEKFKEAIAERMKEMTMTADEALALLSKMARAPQADYMKPTGPNMSKLIEAGHADMISEVKKSQGSINVKFHDQKDALKTILKVYEKIDKPANVNVTIHGFDEMLDKAYGDEPKESEAPD